jgi:N-acetylglucosamine-6-phosphate deacetylase
VCTNSSSPLHECVNCASLNPAAAIGMADKKGSLEKGKDADIIICDEAFKVQKTIIGGVTKYEN